MAASMFQSAPDREVGRCRRVADRLLVDCGFNPRPTVRSGDAGRRPCTWTFPRRFNPRPTVRSGDASCGQPVRHREDVSIRARP